MHLSHFLLLALSFLFCAQASAQNKTAHQWGLVAGWTESWLADQHTSPLLYKSDRLNVGVVYRLEKRLYFEAGFTAGIGTSQPNRLGQRELQFIDRPDLFGVRDTSDFKVNPFLSHFEGRLDAKLFWRLNERHQLGVVWNTRYLATGMSGDIFQYAQMDLGLGYRYQYPLFGGQVEGELSLPLLAGVVRPNYAYDPSLPDETNYFKGFLRTGSAITSVHQFINPRLKAGYTFQFRNGKDVGLHFHAEWTSYPDPRPIRRLEYGINATYFF